MAFITFVDPAVAMGTEWAGLHSNPGYMLLPRYKPSTIRYGCRLTMQTFMYQGTNV